MHVNGAVFSAMAALITSIIECLIMKKRQGKQERVKTTPIHALLSLTPLLKPAAKRALNSLHGNVAYECMTL